MVPTAAVGEGIQRVDVDRHARRVSVAWAVDRRHHLVVRDERFRIDQALAIVRKVAGLLDVRTRAEKVQRRSCCYPPQCFARNLNTSSSQMALPRQEKLCPSAADWPNSG
jgi:hypothetical protein